MLSAEKPALPNKLPALLLHLQGLGIQVFSQAGQHLLLLLFQNRGSCLRAMPLLCRQVMGSVLTQQCQ